MNLYCRCRESFPKNRVQTKIRSNNSQFLAQWNRLWEAAAKLDEAHIYIDDTPSHITELIVAKHRNGPTGRVTLFFKEDCTKFISLTRRKMM